MKTKTCVKCGAELLATTQYFFRRVKNRDGLDNVCKKCVSERVPNSKQAEEKYIPVARSVQIPLKNGRTLVKFGMGFKAEAAQTHGSSWGYSSALSNTRDAPG